MTAKEKSVVLVFSQIFLLVPTVNTTEPDFHWRFRHSDRVAGGVGLFHPGMLRFELDILASESWTDTEPLDDRSVIDTIFMSVKEMGIETKV